MIHNILHISDLHFTNDDKSYLRDNPIEFVNELVNEITSIETGIDYLFITGDLVERNKWDDSDTIVDVIKKIEDKLNVKQTFCVNGNHDIDDIGIITNNYKAIRNDFKVKTPSFSNSWFSSYEISDNHWIIEFDCFSNGKREVILNSIDSYRPLKDSQLKEFKDFIIDNLSGQSQNIYILSHLPAKLNPDSKLLNNESWTDRHIWKDGKIILQLLNDEIKTNTILWFAGDGHVVESYKQADISNYFFLTGRFNGPIEKTGKQREEEYPKEASCQFVRVDTVKSSVIRTVQFSTFQHDYSLDSVKWYSKSVDFVSSTKYLNKFFSSIPEQNYINKSITKAISEKGLYRLVKATTKRKNITLGWIDINRLLNTDNLIKQFLELVNKLLVSEYEESFGGLLLQVL